MSGTQVTNTIDTGHEEAINDAVLDYYGTTLATAGNDGKIKLFDVRNGRQTKIADLTDHTGPIWQYGHILASCGYNGDCIIHQKQQNGQWAVAYKEKRNQAFNSVSWAAAEFGLILAVACGNQHILIIQKTSNGWETYEIPEAHSQSVKSVSWSPGNAPSSLFKKPEEEQSLLRLVSGGDEKQAKIWWKDASKPNSEWQVEAVLDGHSNWITDVAWAPNIGLPEEQIATAGTDNQILIWSRHSNSNEDVGRQWQPCVLPKFDDVIMHLSWSLTGGILACSGGTNHVSLWKQDLSGHWLQVNDTNDAGNSQTIDKPQQEVPTMSDYVMIEQHLPVIKPTTVHIKSKYGAEFRRFAIQPTDQSATGSVKARRLCGVTFDEFQHTLAKLHKLEFQLEADDNSANAQLNTTNQSGDSRDGFADTSIPNDISGVTLRKGIAIGSPVNFRPVSAIIDVDILPPTVRRVRLHKHRTDKPLGFYIKDGSTIRTTASGLEKVPAIFISRLIRDGLASMTGLLNENDEILEVNGINVMNKTLDQVTDMMIANSENLIITVKPHNQRNNPLTRNSHRKDLATEFQNSLNLPSTPKAKPKTVVKGAAARSVLETTVRPKDMDSDEDDADVVSEMPTPAPRRNRRSDRSKKSTPVVSI